jgi:hypothetical protein
MSADEPIRMHPAKNKNLFLVTDLCLAIETYFMLLQSCSIQDTFIHSCQLFMRSILMGEFLLTKEFRIFRPHSKLLLGSYKMQHYNHN